MRTVPDSVADRKRKANTEAHRRWIAKNPDYYKKWRAENPDKVKAAVARCEKLKDSRRRWRSLNADKVREYETRYAKKNWAKTLEKNHRRRARISGAPVVEDIDRFVVFERDNGRCHLCGRFVARAKFTVDHLVPLALGGSHTYANVKIAHGRCNSRKGARFIST